MASKHYQKEEIFLQGLLFYFCVTFYYNALNVSFFYMSYVLYCEQKGGS